jgi:hypothetical protein
MLYGSETPIFNAVELFVKHLFTSTSGKLLLIANLIL